MLLKESLLQTCHALLKVPSVSFKEDWVLQHLDSTVQGWIAAGEAPELRWESDEWGNRIATLGSSSWGSVPPLVFVCSVDCPGFVFPPFQNGIRLEAWFEGDVKEEFFLGSEIRVFCEQGEAGVVGIVTECSPQGGRSNNRFVVIELQEPVINPVLGIWNLPMFEPHEGKLTGAGCSNLCAAAAMLTALKSLAKLKAAVKQPVRMIFTRGREAGFCGTLCLLNSPKRAKLIPEGARVISVELTAETSGLPLGSGAILRVGDCKGSFDNSIINQMWESLSTKISNERPVVHRALLEPTMSGATVFRGYGYRSVAICAGVRNFHNMELRTGELTAEVVDLSDLVELTKLMLHFADQDSATTKNTGEAQSGLSIQMEQYLEKGRQLLT